MVGIFFVFSGCLSNSGGKDLGASGIKKETGTDSPGTCQIPCSHISDCEDVLLDYKAPISSFFEFQWVSCSTPESGNQRVCVAGQCQKDEDCSLLRNFSSEDDSPGSHICRNNACIAPCEKDGSCADKRNKCIKGYCERQPEDPTKEYCEQQKQLGHPCECLTTQDCHDKGWFWTSCRKGICQSYRVNEDAAATGRDCDTDHDCVRNHFSQDLAAAGAHIPDLGRCKLNADDIGTECGSGFTCVALHTTNPALHGQAQIQPIRSVCLPNECAPSGSFCQFDPTKSCSTDDDCPDQNSCGALQYSHCSDVPYTEPASITCNKDQDCSDGAYCYLGRYCSISLSTIFDRCPTGDGSVCPKIGSCAQGPKESTCHPSLDECSSNKDCSNGEECVWPVSGQPGICLDLSCAPCDSWLNKHGGTRKCIHEKFDLQPPEIIRPD